MKFSFMIALTTSVVTACASPAQNTGPVDLFIEGCIGEGFSHQVCACTAIKTRAEIGEQSYGDLLGILARMAELKAQGLDTPVTDPNAGLGEYQVLESARGALLRRGNTLELAYRANRDLCMAQSQN